MKRSTLFGRLLPAAALGALMLLGACNDHNFTPRSEIEVYPTSLTFEEQSFDYSDASVETNGRKYRPKEILLSNVSVTANLGLMEIDFADTKDNSLKAEIREVGEDLGNELNYALGDIIPGSTCTRYEDCFNTYADDTLKCDTATDGGVCRYSHGFFFTLTYNLQELVNVDPSVIIKKDQAAKMVYKPCYLDKDKDTEGNVIDVMKCQYDNVSGTGSCLYKALVDVGDDGSISVKTEGATYECTGMAKPAGLEQDISSTLSPCLSDGSSIDLYGLNKCDRLALVERFKKVDNEEVAEDVELENGLRANYRLFRSSIPNYQLGQVNNVSYCGDENNNSLSLGGDLWQLDDPMAAESCYTEDGKIDTSKLSVDVDKVTIDQLPIAVNYLIDREGEMPAFMKAKEFRMRIMSSADVGGSAARVVTLNINEYLGQPPKPVLRLHADYEAEIKIADKNGIKLDASKSLSPLGEERLPFQYQYRWSSAFRPYFANDSILTCAFCDLANPSDIMNTWTDDSTPKIFIPVAGLYGFELKVRDNQGLESGPTASCPECLEWDTLNLDIKPSEKIHIELTWDKGGTTDFDLYLIRYRDEGTMGYSFPSTLEPESPPVVGCSETNPCPDNASGAPFACSNGSCRWECTSDADCGNVPAAGLICGSNNTCIKRTGNIPCEEDDDCGNYYCNPASYTSEETICTRYSWDAMNDTCFCYSRNPHWVLDSYAEATQNYPSLDIDDVTGYGPENISLKEPLPGRYRVVARLYNTGADEEGGDPIISNSEPATAYVKVYLNGELVTNGTDENGTFTMQFTRANVYWKVGDIEWTGTGDDGSGVFTLLSTTSGAEDFSDNPYANPFYNSNGIGFFDPNSATYPRSIWCDAATDEYAPGVTCAELYAK